MRFVGTRIHLSMAAVNSDSTRLASSAPNPLLRFGGGHTMRLVEHSQTSPLTFVSPRRAGDRVKSQSQKNVSGDATDKTLGKMEAEKPSRRRSRRKKAPTDDAESPARGGQQAGSEKKPPPAQFPIVGIGASAGGLEAFTELLRHLPLDTGMGFVLVQHLDPQHESTLPQLLARATSMPVREVTNNLRVEPNHIYVIPPNTNLSLVRGVLKLQPRQPARVPHHSVNFFFESLARDQCECAIGVILSGAATDGMVGMEAIKAEGGITFAQDDSARYDAMPRSAIAAGCVDFVLTPADIAKELARIAKHPYVAGQPYEPTFPEDDRAAA